MRIGPYEIFTLETGTFRLDGGAMFGVVPKVIWQKTNPADDQNRILLAMRTLVIQGEGKTILVDAGIGTKFDEKYSRIYDIDHSDYDLLRSLKAKGISREDITDVLITHLHFDHIGGATYMDENQQLQLTFPNATFHVQGEQWHWANNPAEKDRASFIKDNFELMRESGKLNELCGPGPVFQDIEVLVMYGHSHGMQLPKISDNKNTLLYCADLIPTASHISLPYIMGYDNNPLVTLEEKKRLLPKVVEDSWTLVFEHDPYRAAATVELSEKGYRLNKEVVL